MTPAPWDAVRAIFPTMESAVAWSFDLLLPDRQVPFAKLTVFQGGFSLDSAQNLLAHDSDIQTIDVLQALIANSLIRTSQRDGSFRFSMLETIRTYGISRLDHIDTDHVTRQRHVQLFCKQAEQDGPRLRSETDEQHRVFLAIEADIANYRTAIEWLVNQGNMTDAATLASALDWFWTDSTYAAKGLRLITHLADSDDVQAKPALHARVLRVQTSLAAGEHDALAELYLLASVALID